MSKISPCLWFVDDAEEAAAFYVTLAPDSKVTRVLKAPADYPGGKEGQVVLVEFTLAGQTFQALNGGSKAEVSYAVSLSIDCADQAEVDAIWSKILENGGREEACGWIRDRWNVPWQIVPRAMVELLNDPDPDVARRAYLAMMEMVKIDVAGVEAAARGDKAA